MKIIKTRVKIIQSIIHLNEKFIFYPRLKRYYKKAIKNSNPVIIDIGVNKGQTIDFFLKISPTIKVFGFEPNNNMFNFLKNKYRRNKNIRLFQNGISSQNGKLVFNENIMNETSTFKSVNIDSIYLKKKAKILGIKKVEQMIVNQYEVNVLKLADIIEEKEIRQIDILKIDTEGHEYDCLLGLFQNKLDCKIDYIQLESHNDDMYNSKKVDIENLLHNNNFLLDAKIRHGFGGIDELIYKNIRTNRL